MHGLKNFGQAERQTTKGIELNYYCILSLDLPTALCKTVTSQKDFLKYRAVIDACL